ncbi:D-beta-D-heptose 1-phosphate adenosyltransferase [Mesorhizobium tianshanense]|uniref:DeoR family transcriptional regulator n=1 Tax=Mesorhizobium tianshanense TaxID=39844 RepID=A0A562MQZ5_9HYPH|nr:DeoR/GlpR family DNA-binding transcription regulator [Mesorhizobium tianshanense]TWI22270.1 DeoR family transcriptional regulator [Mesorhizobium tianshanense]GLS36531.1 D-beta-D-heptose 1-phosphate adenosyltransferase [Mesorhizobium tianshanense]
MAVRSCQTSPAKGGANLGAARQQSILTLINQGDVVSVGEFATSFGVSPETIRRDIRALEEAGHLRRVHGGAAPKRTFDLTARRPVAERLEVDREGKILAAKAAMALFENDMNVFLGASSTMLLVAQELVRSDKRLTITTNMIDIATIVAASGRCTVTLLGGIVNPQTHTVGGHEVLKSLEDRLFDLTVMGTSAVSPVHGILGPTKYHNLLVTTLASRSHQTSFVMDSAKFGRRDAHLALPLSQVDFVATDSLPSGDIAAALEEAGVTVLLPEGGHENRAEPTQQTGTDNQ